ncbi:MAG TPA: FAD-binding oxidoreductase [Acidimicrobiales bacterium]|jgi:decaprenylphospho-beta-D-ribofuranose 2-oxidase|nr:FAD-binding oxidoreductase [Acidimicrobiales bacterium]
MTAVEDRIRTDVATTPLELSGWGRTAPSRAGVASPADEESITGLLGSARRPLIARGLGRSYGDAAQSSGGVVVETAQLTGIGPLDEATGCIEVGGGVSLHRLMQEVIPRGWFVAVTPGTRYVSVGGAIASDIHGKNHHCDGSFARHVESMVLATPTGTRVVTPDDDAELFWATAGGMGLTGIVVRATLRLLPIESSWMQLQNRRFTTLDGLMSVMEQSDDGHRYSVAWLDCLASRAGRRRSILTLGDHAAASALPARLASRVLEAPAEPRLRVPVAPPLRLANRLSVRVLNEGWFRVSSHATLAPLATYFHPLDGIGGWNVLYGPSGFVQYQFAVPPDRGDVVGDAVGSIAASGVPAFLAVLKLFGPGTPGPLSFAQSGWTLALDFPVGPPGLSALLDSLDEKVADAGGRIYLAKDARLRPDLVQTMYPRLAEMAEVRRRVDPEAVLASDLSLRLGL